VVRGALAKLTSTRCNRASAARRAFRDNCNAARPVWPRRPGPASGPPPLCLGAAGRSLTDVRRLGYIYPRPGLRQAVSPQPYP
ncbi:Alpha-2-macroglobulin, partial [Frankliniella fusca]